jgi:hypothetical protein
MIAFWINYGAQKNIDHSSSALYAVPLALQAVPAICLSVGCIFVPERYTAANSDSP